MSPRPDPGETRVVTVSREIAASPERIFALIADPAQQPRWDGNDNLAAAPGGQRVRRAGDVFTMTLTTGSVRENHVTEFEEGCRIAWRPSEVGRPQPGHLWRWELVPADGGVTLVTHTYDWTGLADKHRLGRARATTADRLSASLDRLAALAEAQDAETPAAAPSAELPEQRYYPGIPMPAKRRIRSAGFRAVIGVDNLYLHWSHDVSADRIWILPLMVRKLKTGI